MKRYAKVIIPALAASFAALSAQAGQLDIQWRDTGEFRDVRADGTGMGQRRFEERVVRDLSAYFDAAAERFVPAGHTLQVSVRDVDLAGEVEYFHRGFESGIRVIRDIDFPRVEFSWVLFDDNGTEISGGDEEIRDMSFKYTGLEYNRGEPFYYEERLINQWFRDTFFDPDLS